MGRFLLAFLAALLACPGGTRAEISGREDIATLSCSSDERMVTTGNAAQNEIKYEAMHLGDHDEFEGKTVPAAVLQDLAYFSRFKNALIVDFPSQDPKAFKPDLPNYYKVAAQRGVIFTGVAVFILLTLFAVFYVRIFNGECGGYKTIIRKPHKSQRYSVFARISAGLLLFAVGFALTAYFSFHDRTASLEAGAELRAANDAQLDRIQQITKDIRHINKKKFNVIYSVLSYEHFQIGWFLDNITDTYERSRARAEEIRQALFVGTKNNVFIKYLFIVLAVFGLLITWFFVYKNRSLTNGLVVAFAMGLVAVYMMHVLGSSFNYFSIFTELCQESADTFDPTKPNMRVRFENSFQSFLTCLPQKQTEMLTAQMNSLLIAENTLLTVMRNFFKTADISLIAKFDGLDSAVAVDRRYDKIRDAILRLTSQEGKVDLVLRQNMIKVLETARDIPLIYSQANKLHNCQRLRAWNHLLNQKLCTQGLRFQYYSLFSFLLSFVGVVIIAAGFFSSENIIRGLYNEEIQYVKTNKLRYDWN